MSVRRATLPRLVSESENLIRLNGTNRHIGELEALRYEVSDILRKLYVWRWWWEADWGDRVYNILPSRNITQAYDDNGDPLFESLIWYTDIDRGNDIVQYNTVLMFLKLVHARLGMLEAPAPPPPPGLVAKQPTTSGVLLLPGQAMTSRDCALEVCRSMDYLLLPVHAVPGALDLLGPARSTYLNLEPESKISRWLEKLCADIADNIGFEMGRWMASNRNFDNYPPKNSATIRQTHQYTL